MTTLLIIIAWLFVSEGQVTITVAKHYWLKIDLRDEIRLIPKRVSANIVRGYDFVQITENAHHIEYARLRDYVYVRHWLIFKIAFILSELTEVGQIYPKGYNWQNDPEWEEKFEQLSNTEYFA